MATISGLSQSGRNDNRPWRDSQGRYWIIGRSSADTTKLVAMMATDRNGTYTAQDTANAPTSSTGAIVSSSVKPDCDKLHVSFQGANGAGNDSAYYCRLNMTTGLWEQVSGSSRQLVVRAAETGNTAGTDLAIRPDGSKIVLFHDTLSGALTRIGATYISADDLTVTYLGYIAGGGTDNQVLPKAVTGQGGIVYGTFISNDGGTRDIKVVPINTNNAIGTVRSTSAVPTTSSDYSLGIPTVVVRASTTTISIPYIHENGAVDDLRTCRFTSPTTFDAALSFSFDQIVALPAPNPGQPAVCLAYDGYVRVATFVRGDDSDVYVTSDLGAFTWAAATSKASGTFTFAYGNVFDTPSGPEFGVVYGSGTTADYVGTSLSSTYDELSDCQFPDLPSRIGPFRSGVSLYAFFTGNQEHRLVAMKSTNGGATWAAVGNEIQLPQNGRTCQDAGLTTMACEVRSIWAEELDGDYWIITQMESGDAHLSIFDPGTDAFTTRLEQICNGRTPNHGPVSYGGVSFKRLSTGVLRALITYHPVGTSDYHIGLFSRSVGGTWSRLGAGDPGVASTVYFNPIAAGVDSNDRFNWGLCDNTNSDVLQMSVSAGGTFSSATTIYNGSGSQPPCRIGKAVQVGYTFYLPFQADDGTISVAEWTSGASPTITIHPNIGDVAVYRYNQGVPPLPASMFGLNLVQDRPLLAYIRNSDQDIALDINATTGSTDEVIASSVTASYLGAEVYGDTLGYFYQNSNVLTFGTRTVGIPMGGSGYPAPHGLMWKRKRFNQKVDDWVDEAAQTYRDLTTAKPEVQKKAAKIVRPFVKPSVKYSLVPKPETVDWPALINDVRGAKALLALWEQQQAQLDEEEELFMTMVA